VTNAVRFAPWQTAALLAPSKHFAMFGGVASGKTFTGSHFVINRIQTHPEQTGFIGANTYDQLSQATLRELFYWLEVYGFSFVQDKRPPKEWGSKTFLKDYNNVLSVKVKHHVVTIFTRVLGDGNPLRGIEFSWYWLDETRDTPQTTHDIVLSRMRESEDVRGLITTTPNGEDWTYNRFCRGAKRDKMYGALHVRTEEAVKFGFITKSYYDTMRASYSELMAAQELDALHVNVLGGRAYYAFGEANKSYIAPWGDQFPQQNRPLIVGCDFNYNPAPHIWMVGQLGPETWTHPRTKVWGPECIHWFGEIAKAEGSSPEMAQLLVDRFPGFFYRVFGDVSGGKGTTSNAGVTDYDQMAQVFVDNECAYTIDKHQNIDEKMNPKVRSRVENMNRLARNALGETRITYNPNLCPYFDGDVRVVGWKGVDNLRTRHAMLDNGGNVERTHASDGAGYAIYKLFPPKKRGRIVSGGPSAIRNELGGVL
jgi:hypothetical protein